MQVACPTCSTQLEADPAQRDHLGRIRLGCGDCGAMVLIQVRAPALRVDDNIPTADGGGAATHGSLDFTVLQVTTEVDDRSDADPAAWVVVLDDLGRARLTAVRTVLMRVPRFSGNLNRLQDQLEQLPFVLTGLSREQSERLTATIGALGGRCRAGPGANLLDRSGRPLPEDEVEPWDRGGDTGRDVAPPPPEPPVSASACLLATVDHIPGLVDTVGLVKATVVTPAATGQAAATLEAALTEAQDLLRTMATERNAAAVVAVRTTLASLPDGSLLLLMQGTAMA